MTLLKTRRLMLQYYVITSFELWAVLSFNPEVKILIKNVCVKILGLHIFRICNVEFRAPRRNLCAKFRENWRDGVAAETHRSRSTRDYVYGNSCRKHGRHSGKSVFTVPSSPPTPFRSLNRFFRSAAKGSRENS